MKSNIEQITANFPDCCDTQKNKVAEEKTRKFTIECSQKYYLKIRVDGCYIKDKNIKKCDYLFIRDYQCLHDETEFYFVELKGSEIDKAVEQIKSTIVQLKKEIPALQKKMIFGFIVSSKTPKGGTDVTKLKQGFAKYGKKLEIKNNHLVYKPK